MHDTGPYVKGTDSFFTMHAEWTMNNKTQYVNTTEYDFTGLKLFDPKDTSNKNIMHRFGFLMHTPIYRTNAALAGGLLRMSTRPTSNLILLLGASV